MTCAPCFSKPLLTLFAQAAQNGFCSVQMMTPTFLPYECALLAARSQRTGDGDGRDDCECRERNPTQ